MWIYDHPYLMIYLLGCGAALIAIFCKAIIILSVDWIIKANILNKNLKKLLPPEKDPLWKKIVAFIGVVLFESTLSWLNVAVVLWQVVTSLLRVTRDVLAPAPEEIKKLRFPLRNNPNMSRESVWAYMTALRVRSGEEPPSIANIIANLSYLSDNYPGFDRLAALKQLHKLSVIDADVMAASFDRLENSKEG